MCIASCHACWRNLSTSYESWTCKPTSTVNFFAKTCVSRIANFQRTPGAIILSITYGIDIKSADDRFLNANLEAAHALAAVLVPGKFLADVIPIRACLCAQTAVYRHLMNLLIVRYIPDWFPGTGFKALAKEARDKFKISVDGPLEYVKNAMKVRPRSRPDLDRFLNLSVSVTPVRRGCFPVHSVRLFVSFGGGSRASGF